MLERIASHYKDNDERVYAYVYLNDETQMFETHFYDGVVKEEPPVGLFIHLKDALSAALEWVK